MGRAFMERVEAEAEPQAVPLAGAPHFLVHNEGDHVGVAVQDVEPGAAVVVYMDSERSIGVQVLEKVPLGHKVALADLDAAVDLVEYQVPVGRTRRPIRKGELVHVHNLKSRRWQKSE
jgi:(2R)-sulfolactate sulfo-lyase subunit alpha